MASVNRSVKVWMAVSLISLLVYDAYILRGSFAIFFGYFAQVPQDVAYVTFTGSVFWLGFIGLLARFLAGLLGLAAGYLLWVKAKPFLAVKKMVALALFLEGVNFLALVPSIWFLLSPGRITFSPSLGIGYILQILFTVPFLWLLAAKVAKYNAVLQRSSMLKFVAVAFVGYTVALVANEMLRWASMISADTLQFIFQGIRAVGFFNAVAFMPFAIVFALLGAYRLIMQNERAAMKWFAVSLFVIGLNYAIHIVYSYFADSLNFLPLVDVWTVPLLGLGIALMINSRKPQAI